MLSPSLGSRSSIFERLEQFRTFQDQRAPKSSAVLRGSPGSSGKLRELGSGPLALLTLLDGR
eukprot:7688114-Alexandrium_andersonii.AAC.1